jgi:hypothetical protein
MTTISRKMGLKQIHPLYVHSGSVKATPISMLLEEDKDRDLIIG